MLLFVAQEYNSYFGGGVITHRNLLMCQHAFGTENVKTFMLPSRRGGIHTLLEFSTGYLMGLTKQLKDNLLELLYRNKEIKFVFLDYSLHGRLAQIIKLKFPDIQIIIFFHNIEIKYFTLYLKTSKKLHHIIGLPSIILNEKKSIKYANHIITLNSRDSDYLYNHFGRKADLILATSIEDTFKKEKLVPVLKEQKISLLFVGSRFFPNEQGLEWFIKNVIPNVSNVHLKIVGNGFEALKTKWNSNSVEVIGSSSQLDNYYYEADLVIAPIFVGSGMKTKTAEALMYGKTILATTEAFEGYNIDKSLIGKECNSANDYIEFINTYQPPATYKFNSVSRSFFNNLYSFEIVKRQFENYILSLGDFIQQNK